jgi:hypothetical protein
MNAEPQEGPLTIADWKLSHERRLGIEKKLLLERIGLPRLALEFDGDVDQTAAMAAVGMGITLLVLSGSPGTGKTFAAVRWIVDYVNDSKNWTPPGVVHRMLGRPPVWTTGPSLSRWDHWDPEQMAKLLRAPRLVIDDLGTEFLDKGGFYASLLDEVINQRYEASLPIVITTNLDKDGFKARYGERIADRIRQSGKAMGCGNQSMRKPA